MKFKIFVFVLLIFFLSGFRVMVKDNPWNLSVSDNTLWIKICNKAYEHSFDEMDIPETDPYAGNTMNEIEPLVITVLKNYNSINSSYLNLELISESGELIYGTHTYDPNTSPNKLIDFCIMDNDGGSGSPQWNGDKMESCEIRLGGKDIATTKIFTSLFTHELGHCLGLIHPQDTKYAIMSYFKIADVYRLELDDKMAITYLYPTTESKKFEQTVGLSCSRKE